MNFEPGEISLYDTEERKFLVIDLSASKIRTLEIPRVRRSPMKPKAQSAPMVEPPKGEAQIGLDFYRPAVLPDARPVE